MLIFTCLCILVISYICLTGRSTELLDGGEALVGFVEGVGRWLQAIFDVTEVENSAPLKAFAEPNEVIPVFSAIIAFLYLFFIFALIPAQNMKGFY